MMGPEAEAKTLNHGDFVRRARKLRRIGWNMWFLLFSFAAYAAIPWCAEGRDSWLHLLFIALVAAPFVFQLFGVLAGKEFRCPVCGAGFDEGTAPLAAASGRCPICASAVFELPAAEGVFDRAAFTAYHRPDRERAKLERIVAVLAAVILLTALVWTCGWLVITHPGLRPFYRIWVEFDFGRNWGIVIFGLFMLAYLAARMPWRPAREFERCPRCGERFTGRLPEIAVATGRCGFCGEKILSGTAEIHGGAVYRPGVFRAAIPEFFWFTQGVLAFNLIFFSQADDPVLLAWAWYGILGLDLLLLASFETRLNRSGCRHRRPGRIAMVTGRCGGCGADLTADPELFQPVGDAVWIHLKNGTVCRAVAGALMLVLLAGVGLQAVKGVSGQTSAVDPATVIFGNLLLAGMLVYSTYLVFRRQRVTGILLSGEEMILVGRRNSVFRKEELTELELKEIYNPHTGRFVEQWSFGSGKRRCVISDVLPLDGRAARRTLEEWLGIFTAPVPDEFREESFSFSPRESPGRLAKLRKRRRTAFRCGAAGIALLIPGFVTGLFFLIAIGLLLLLIPVPLMLCDEQWEERAILRKYTGVTFLHDGVRLEGRRPRFIPLKKISWVSDGLDAFGDGYGETVGILSSVTTFRLRSDWFADPEHFVAVFRSWRNLLPPPGGGRVKGGFGRRS